MCLDCGCHQPENDHGDPRHITLADLTAAAAASGVTIAQAAANIVGTLASPPVPVTADTVDAAISDLETEVAKAGAGEQRYVLGVAYQAGRDPRIAKGVDGGRDFFTEAELERAAWSLLVNGPRVGAFHLPGTDEDGGQAQIVESYIYRNDEPWVIPGGPGQEPVIVRKGDWLVGAILSERAWQLVKAGKIGGWSPQGVARRRTPVRRAA